MCDQSDQAGSDQDMIRHMHAQTRKGKHQDSGREREGCVASRAEARPDVIRSAARAPHSVTI